MKMVVQEMGCTQPFLENEIRQMVPVPMREHLGNRNYKSASFKIAMERIWFDLKKWS